MDALMISISGMRGTIGGTLTPVVVANYAAAFAAYLKERKAGQRQPFPRGHGPGFASVRPVCS